MPEPDSYTTHRPIRVEDSLWDELGEAVGLRKRSALVRDLIRWWLRIPGAKLPERPPRHSPSS
jgi:hypothetical protein